MPPSDDKEKVENEENEKNDMSDSKSNQSDKSDKSDKSKETPKKGKGKKDMADKMDPARFQDGGVNFKAKLIGLENVPDARGDKMCQDAMMKLKGMVKTAKAHKPKVTVNVSLEGLKIIDEISQNVMHHHAVHKISFISRDIKDARAFGYIYGLGEGKHQFFGIKTDKPAETLVLTLRDLFQVVFEMKKQEVEAAKARKSAKDDEKTKDGDKTTESDTEKPAAQEGAYDVPRHLYHRHRHRQRFRHDTYPASGGSEAPKEGGEKTIPQSNSSANLLDLENQLLNLEVTFEQVDAFSAAAPVAASAAAATTQFPVSFEQNFGNQAMGAQRDPFNTPTLAPPPNYGTQQQQQKQPMQQQQQPFPQPKPGDPFNTDPFGQGQFGVAPVQQGQPPAQQAPVVQQQVQPMQQPSFAAFPPQQAQMQSPQHAMPQMQPPQQQQQFPPQQFPPQQFPPQQPPPQYNAVQQQQQQQQQPPQGAFGSMPVQQDPFKDDPFFTQTQGNDRYAAFTSLGPAQTTASAPVQAMMGAPLQPMQPGGQAPASPNMNATHQSPVQAAPQDSFGDLGSLAEFKPANQYVDRTQFFKAPEQPKPSLNAMAPQQPQQPQPQNGTVPVVPARQFQGNPFAAQNQWTQ